MSTFSQTDSDKSVTGFHVRALREARGWSLSKLANALHQVDEQVAPENYRRMISRWESGKAVNSRNLDRLRAVFGPDAVGEFGASELSPVSLPPAVAVLGATQWEDLLPFAQADVRRGYRGYEPCIGDFDSDAEFEAESESVAARLSHAVATEGTSLARQVWAFWTRTGVRFQAGTYLHSLFLQRLEEFGDELLYRQLYCLQDVDEDDWAWAKARAAWEALVACTRSAGNPDAPEPGKLRPRSIGERLAAAESNGPLLARSRAAA